MLSHCFAEFDIVLCFWEILHQFKMNKTIENPTCCEVWVEIYFLNKQKILAQLTLIGVLFLFVEKMLWVKATWRNGIDWLTRAEPMLTIIRAQPPYVINDKFKEQVNKHFKQNLCFLDGPSEMFPMITVAWSWDYLPELPKNLCMVGPSNAVWCLLLDVSWVV